MAVGRNNPKGVTILGSCFLLKEEGLFATASHVTENNDNNLVIIISKEDKLSNYQDTTDTNVQMLKAEISKIDPIHDTAILKADVEANSNLKVSSLDNMKVGDQISIFGYPHADHGRMVLTKQDSKIGAKILLDNNGVKTKHAVINLQTRPGQSGSPVIHSSTKKVVGILVGAYVPNTGGGLIVGGLNPQSLHPTTHIVSTEYLKEML
ncbi:S1 family peptidase [Halanaerobacter jeridensis]|nr:serine protease [Halanaerobacter jeridensis]